MRSQEIAGIFREIAVILELKGDNPFRIRAYSRAAEAVEKLGDELEDKVNQEQLTTVPGIGSDLAAKIKEIVSTGSLKFYQKLKQDIPAGVIELLQIPGLGPKTVRLIYEKKGIDSIDKLIKAAQAGTLAQLAGIREKTVENILRGVAILKKGRERTPFYLAQCSADSFIKELKKIKEVRKIEVAGSLRRKKAAIRDIDILVISSNPKKVMDKFASLPLVAQVLLKGQTKSSVLARDNNIQVDLRVVDKKSFGSALLYFTGSKEFNLKLRQLAMKNNYKINEYGLFSQGKKLGEKFIAGASEEGIFTVLGMDYIRPELREDLGEIEAALKKNLPKLVNLKDIRGDLHVHCNYSDGRNSIEEIARAAKKRGYEYLGVADHSQGLRIAKGVSIEQLYEKIEEIKRVNKKLKNIKVLAGAEVDILGDGSLDYPDKVLSRLDFVIAAIHSGFKQSREQLTQRIVTACKNKYVNIIAHPTGVLWGSRDPYEIDLGRIIQVCRDYKVALEVNSHPYRLDLRDSSAMRAKKGGVKLAINTDSHAIEQLEFMELGLNLASRGWLEKADIVNCMGWEELVKWLKK
ncbi:MAG: DNA polymerase/3'-5' exonuclease PolX [Candidatus Omnitrophota bacterium]